MQASQYRLHLLKTIIYWCALEQDKCMRPDNYSYTFSTNKTIDITKI